MKCDACSSIFCKDHIKYDEHQCSSSYRKNIQIPICPLCNQAVPYEYRDQSPDRVVSAHIDRDCRSDPARAKRQKVYSNKCSVSSCKQREAIQVNCEKCLKTFCLRHRFPDDHRCQGLNRETNRNQEQDDFLLAQALQESEREEAAARRRRVTVTTLKRIFIFEFTCFFSRQINRKQLLRKKIVLFNNNFLFLSFDAIGEYIYGIF